MARPAAGRAAGARARLRALALQWTFVASLVQIVTRERAGWNYVPRTQALDDRSSLPGWPPLSCRHGARCRPRCCYTTWFEALALFVGVNTLFFAALSLFQVLPPIRKTRIA